MTPRFSGRGLSTAITILSAGYRPLGSCSRAAGWSAATLCLGTFETWRPEQRMSVHRGGPEVEAGLRWRTNPLFSRTFGRVRGVEFVPVSLEIFNEKLKASFF